MDLGLFGILNIIDVIHSKKFGKEQAACDEIAKKEMEEFCNKAAERYGITRGINLLDLQHKIAKEGYVDEEVGMKNEDAVVFLEKEREEIQKRKEAMFDRMSKLPIEAEFSLDKTYIKSGSSIQATEGGLRYMLNEAGDYIERNGIDFPTDGYAERIYHWANCLTDEIDKELGKRYKGLNGEEYVSQQLKLYEGKYKVLENIVIESNDSQGETSEVDTYIITDKGLVVAEVKNFGNENQRLHITSDGRWVIEDIHNGHVLRRFDKSPVEQNARHCLAIERVLQKELGEDCEIPIIPVVFIANNKVAIQNESQSPVIRVSEFYTFINSFTNGAKISKELQAKIEETLEEKNIGAREFGVQTRLNKMKCLEDLEKEFTKYILYNHDVAEVYQKVMQKNKAHVSSVKYWLIALIPYILFFLIGFTTQFRIVLIVSYTICIFSIPLGILAGVIMFLFGEVLLKLIGGLGALLFLGVLCGGLNRK